MNWKWQMRFIQPLALLAVLPAIGAASPAQATATTVMAQANSVVLTSEAYIERAETGPDGKEKPVLKRPADVIVVPGDRVVFRLVYANKGAEPATGFRATNPLPGPVQFLSVAEDWAEVSVDGGTNWGKLSALSIVTKNPDGSEVTRPASAEDVTHIRWIFADAIAPGATGSVSYRGLIK